MTPGKVDHFLSMTVCLLPASGCTLACNFLLASSGDKWAYFLERPILMPTLCCATKARSPRPWLFLWQIRREISMNTCLIALSKEKSEVMNMHTEIHNAQCTMYKCTMITAKASQRLYPSWRSLPWRLSMRGSRLLISKEISSHMLLTVFIFNRVRY